MRNSLIRKSLFAGATFVMSLGASLNAQEKSVAPEINNAFRKPDIDDFRGKFEKEGREAFEHRKEIVKACNIREGMQVADVEPGLDCLAVCLLQRLAPRELFLRWTSPRISSRIFNKRHVSRT